MAAVGGAALGASAFMGASVMMDGMSLEDPDENIAEEDALAQNDVADGDNGADAGYVYNPEPVVEPEDFDPNEIMLDVEDLRIDTEPADEYTYNGPITSEDIVLEPDELVVDPDADGEILLAEAEPLDPDMIEGWNEGNLMENDMQTVEPAVEEPYLAMDQADFPDVDMPGMNDFDIMNDILG